jgi:HEAT repeat protein
VLRDGNQGTTVTETSAFIAALKDPDRDVRRSAAEALGNVGPPAPEALSALVAALHDQNADVRQSAAEALGKVGPLRRRWMITSRLNREPVGIYAGFRAWAPAGFPSPVGASFPEIGNQNVETSRRVFAGQ